MKKVIALRHIHFEDLGTLEPVLIEQGYQVQYIDPSVESLRHVGEQDADLWNSMGSFMDQNGLLGGSVDVTEAFVDLTK